MRTPREQTWIDVVGGYGRQLGNQELIDVADEIAADYPVDAPPAVDVWTWPVVGGKQHISEVGGEVQNSDAHIARGGGPAVDLPGYEGQTLDYLVNPVNAEKFWYGDEGGNMVDYSWQGSRGRWDARYCHMNAPGSMQMGHTGKTDGGAHLHLLLWLDGVQVRPEDQAEFQALLP